MAVTNLALKVPAIHFLSPFSFWPISLFVGPLASWHVLQWPDRQSLLPSVLQICQAILPFLPAFHCFFPFQRRRKSRLIATVSAFFAVSREKTKACLPEMPNWPYKFALHWLGPEC